MPLRLLMVAQPDLVAQALQVVQHVVTGHLLDDVGFESYVGRGGAGGLKIIAAALKRPVIK
jgi:hypothetical protein